VHWGPTFELTTDEAPRRAAAFASGRASLFDGRAEETTNSSLRAGGQGENAGPRLLPAFADADELRSRLPGLAGFNHARRPPPPARQPSPVPYHLFILNFTGPKQQPGPEQETLVRLPDLPQTLSRSAGHVPMIFTGTGRRFFAAYPGPPRPTKLPGRSRCATAFGFPASAGSRPRAGFASRPPTINLLTSLLARFFALCRRRPASSLKPETDSPTCNSRQAVHHEESRAILPPRRTCHRPTRVDFSASVTKARTAGHTIRRTGTPPTLLVFVSDVPSPLPKSFYPAPSRPLCAVIDRAKNDAARRCPRGRDANAWAALYPHVR